MKSAIVPLYYLGIDLLSPGRITQRRLQMEYAMAWISTPIPFPGSSLAPSASPVASVPFDDSTSPPFR